MSVRAAGLSALLVLSSFAPSAAGPAVEAAAEAERLAADEMPVEALRALDEAAEAIWEAAPLAFRTALAVAESNGFGVYAPAEDSTYRVGETMSVYAEPIGFGYRRDGDMNVIALQTDLEVLNPTGQVIAEAEGLFDVTLRSRHRNREFNMTLSFKVPDLRDGDYRAVFTVRDENSDKSGSFEIPFTVAAEAENDSTTGGATPTDETARTAPR